MHWQFIVLAAALSGFLQGLTGLGYSILMVALLVVGGGDLLPSTILATITCIFCQGTIIVRLRKGFRFSILWPMALGALAGVPIGLLLIERYGGEVWLRSVFGGFVVAASVWLLCMPRRPHVKPRPRYVLGIGAGVLSGLAGGMFNTGGPPAVLYAYSRPVALDVAKATVQWLFTGMAVCRLILLWAEGLLRADIWLRGLVAALPVVLGTVGGLWLARRTHPDVLRAAVYLVLILIGLKLLLWP